MDRVVFGDNQFFGISHLSEERARTQAMRFRDLDAIIEVLDAAYRCGITTFMCTTHDRIEEVCDFFRSHQSEYPEFGFYPCMPYAHKYNSAVAELGAMAAIRKFTGGNMISSLATGGLALAKRDLFEMMKLLVDAEMRMFHGLKTEVIFLQNVVTDLLLGLGLYPFFTAFGDYVAERYGARAGFITMNLPALATALKSIGIKDPIICASINKIGYRMGGGRRLCEAALRQEQCSVMAMQVLAAGAIPPEEALEYVCRQPSVRSILFGASTIGHIRQTKELIDGFSVRAPGANVEL